MKVLATLLFSLFTVVLLAQVEPTTQEEYNYVTKGYKIQQESGLDMKKGYSIKTYPVRADGTVLVSAGLFNETHRVFVQASGLYRDAEVHPCAIIITYTNINKNFTEHFCIPSANAATSLWLAHQKRISEFAVDARLVIYSCVAMAAAHFAKE